MDDENLKLAFQVVGGLLGIIAFFWNLVGYLWTYVFSHLQLDISNEKVEVGGYEKLKVTTTVENKGSIAKKIDFAFLLVNPDKESFKSSLLKITSQGELENDQADVANLLQDVVEKRAQLNGIIIAESFVIYTLPYFYEEQFQIGNEKVKYSCILDLAGLRKDHVYHIRFVTISRHLFNTYLRHRSTSDLFIH